MSIEVDVLSELYTIMKQYVPAKDRQECADNIMSVMVDYLNDVDVKEFGGTDGALKRALREYAGEDDEHHDEDYED
jgi:hypothetical protein